MRTFIICPPTEYNSGYYNQKHEMSGACSTYGQKRNGFLTGGKNKKKFLEELDINGRAMLT
jgi:hypothetical protein